MNILKDNILTLFIRYSLYSVMGLLAISTTVIIDGFFVGNYVGDIGIAAINITYPLVALLFAFSFMFTSSSSAVCGEAIGQGNIEKASNIFSRSITLFSILSIILCIVTYIASTWILSLMETSDNLKVMAIEYLGIILLFYPILMCGLMLESFVRIDNHPGLAFLSLVLTSITNILLDYVFVVILKQGILGAAFATGISYVVYFIVLITYFFRKSTKLKFKITLDNYSVVFKDSLNGISEFLNESSAGIVTFIFNIVMLNYFGDSGVSAFAIVSYMLTISLMINAGISIGVQPLISTNYGANKKDRIIKLLWCAIISSTIIGILLAIFTLFNRDFLISIFLTENNLTYDITYEFLLYFWPVSIFNGINITVTAYFTALQKPKESGLISILRSLILPIVLISTLPFFIGEKGIFISTTLAEILTVTITLMLLFYSNKKILNSMS